MKMYNMQDNMIISYNNTTKVVQIKITLNYKNNII
jgi:uncharacterized protein YqkB